ncbi:hypothetical protein [Castellaniella sp. MT123]|uniref:hypothetical protein n=1 Tax=Castellaniella sp. MT123 TaxID=3140381 RepID=UPI0031F406DE
MPQEPADITDPLAGLALPQTQAEATRLAQRLFTLAFRQAAGSPASQSTLDELRDRGAAWCDAANSRDARALRLALLLTGLDQWGLAFSQAFGITAMPVLSALLGGLRTDLDPQEDACFQRWFAQIDAVEAAAIDFKIELRRAIHLALWHAMAAETDLEAAQPVLHTLGSLLLALDARMPTLGWRLVADTLAHVQIGLIDHPDLPELAQSGTRCLFAALREALPREHYERIMAHATQAVLGWQHAHDAARH